MESKWGRGKGGFAVAVAGTLEYGIVVGLGERVRVRGETNKMWFLCFTHFRQLLDLSFEDISKGSE